MSSAPTTTGLAVALALACAALTPSAATAGESIFMGEPVVECGWPSVVAVRTDNGHCSGTLVHERLVTYAAHCGAGDKIVVFGNLAFGEDGVTVQEVATESCAVYPEYAGPSDRAHDWAYCVLAQPVTEIPTTPIVHGCELAHYYKEGQAVVVAGFGDNTMDGGSGLKRWAESEIVGLFDGYFGVGGNGQPASCSGDSGGPVLVQFQDGTWHNLGIASTVGGTCGSPGQYALASDAVPWIEESAGVDITPCFTAEGEWDASPGCTGFATTGAEGFGVWSEWCPDTPASGPSSTCGPGLDDGPDHDPPAVAITTPEDGASFEPQTSLSIELSVDDGDGWGIARAWIEIDGAAQPDILAPPYSLANLQFPQGTFTLVGFAEDFAANVGESAPVTIYVGVDPPMATGTDTATSDSDSDGTTAGPTTTGDTTGAEGSSGPTTEDPQDGPNDGPGDGCGCRGDDLDGPLPAVLLLLLGARRRRSA